VRLPYWLLHPRRWLRGRRIERDAGSGRNPLAVAWVALMDAGDAAIARGATEAELRPVLDTFMDASGRAIEADDTDAFSRAMADARAQLDAPGRGH
jgi:hypothetical protein